MESSVGNRHEFAVIIVEVGIQFCDGHFDGLNGSTRSGSGVKELSISDFYQSIIGRFYTANATADNITIRESRHARTIDAGGGSGILNEDVTTRLMAYREVAGQFEVGVFRIVFEL